MSEYRKLVEQFFERYERPTIDPFIMGFSGIDPPLKQTAGIIDHEQLNGLMGGNDEGHYHLTAEEYEGLKELLSEKYPPQIYAGQVINVVASEPMTPYEIQGQDVRM